jgi:stress-induced morphogen
MPVKREILQDVLEKAFPDSDIMLNALTGDDDHWEVTVKSGLFNGKSRIDQHRLVSTAVNDLNIHALSIKTLS